LGLIEVTVGVPGASADADGDMQIGSMNEPKITSTTDRDITHLRHTVIIFLLA
jgi:hypothetical protein